MRKLLIPLGILLLLLVTGGLFAFRAMGEAMKAKAEEGKGSYKVAKGEILVRVIETGNVDAIRSVEVKSRVSGRLAQLLVDEGARVVEGQLIGVIDPKETELLVDQNSAQLRGAETNVTRGNLEMRQRAETVQAQLRQAEARVAQLELELKSQPTLSQAAIQQAQAALNTAQQEKERLLQNAFPTQRVSARTTLDEAKASFENAQRELDRRKGLEAMGYIAGREVDTAQLQVESARARLAQAQASYERLEAGLQTDLAKAEAQIRQARAELTRARANQIQDQLKRKEYESAQAALASARASLQDPAILRQQIAQSQASVDQLRSVLQDARRQLGETEIRSPITGIVTKKMLEVGELASGLSGFSSGTSILKIEDRTRMRVKLSMNEIDVAKLRVGMPAAVEVDALPQKQFTGKITKIAPASDALASTPTGQSQSQDIVVKYQVELILDQTDPALRSGMSCKVTVDVVQLKDVLVVPVDYITKEANEYFAWLPGDPKDPKSKPKKTRVTVGVSSGSQFQILSGLTEGTDLVRPDYAGPKRKSMFEMGGGGEEGKEEGK